MNNKPLASLSIASALLLAACSNQNTVTANVSPESGNIAGQQTNSEQIQASTTHTEYESHTPAESETYYSEAPENASWEEEQYQAIKPAPKTVAAIPHYPAQPSRSKPPKQKVPHWPEHLNKPEQKVPHYAQGHIKKPAKRLVTHVASAGTPRKKIPHYAERPTFNDNKLVSKAPQYAYAKTSHRLPSYKSYANGTPPMQVAAGRTYYQQQSRRTPTYHSAVTPNRRSWPSRPVTPPSQKPPTSIAELGADEIRTIGDRIFVNESGGDIDKLVHWNVGENFASMGIGHFTWYPNGRRVRFGNTFPGLLDHLQNNGVQLPAWVRQAKRNGAPWRSRSELAQAKRSGQVGQLQNLLYQTRYIQAQYIFNRAKRAMPRLVKATPSHLRPLVAQNLNAVANSKGGWYALIDYVNFKGEGLNRRGGYRGQNWGLLQVLENMRPSQPGPQALQNFADSATQILQRRVNNSDPRRNEARWMRGWTVRINTYRPNIV